MFVFQPAYSPLPYSLIGSSVVMCWHWLYLLSWVVICCHLISFVIMCSHELAYFVMGFMWFCVMSCFVVGSNGFVLYCHVMLCVIMCCLVCSCIVMFYHAASVYPPVQKAQIKFNNTIKQLDHSNALCRDGTQAMTLAGTKVSIIDIMCCWPTCQ